MACAERVAMRNPGGSRMASHNAGAVVGGHLAVGAVPAVVRRIHLRLEHRIGNALGQIDGGEHDLLDHLARLIAELRLERHRSFFVDPQAVTVAVLVARMQRDDARLAAEQALAFATADFINERIAFVDRRQGAEQRTVRSAALDEHRAFVGEIAGELRCLRE